MLAHKPLKKGKSLALAISKKSITNKRKIILSPGYGTYIHERYCAGCALTVLEKSNERTTQHHLSGRAGRRVQTMAPRKVVAEKA